MFSTQLETKSFAQGSAQSAGLMDHPVFAVMPSKVRSLLSAEARPMTLLAGEEAAENTMIFVMKGGLALYDVQEGMAVGLLGAQSFLAGAGPFQGEPPTRARGIVPSVIYTLPIATLLQLSGTSWSNRFLTAHATSRARLVGSERFCKESHSDVQRLARWCLRFEGLLAGGLDSLSSEELAGLVGIDQVALARAWMHLAERGAVAPQVGRFKGMVRHELMQTDCCCDDALNDGGLERRSRRRLLRRH